MPKKEEIGYLFPLTSFKFYMNGKKLSGHTFEVRGRYGEFIEVLDLDTQKRRLCWRKRKVIPLKD